MAKLGKHSLLAASIVLFALVLLALKQWVGTGQAPSASIQQPKTSDGASGPVTTSPQRPRVVQAKPITAGPAEASPVQPEHIEQGELKPVSPFQMIAPVLQETPSGTLPEEESTVSSDATPWPSRGEVEELTPEPETDVADVLDDKTESPAQFPRNVVTRDSDSFWTISEEAYGTGIYYRALFRHNRTQVLRPDQLGAGVSLEVPSLDVLEELYPEDFAELSRDDR